MKNKYKSIYWSTQPEIGWNGQGSAVLRTPEILVNILPFSTVSHSSINDGPYTHAQKMEVCMAPADRHPLSAAFQVAEKSNFYVSNNLLWMKWQICAPYEESRKIFTRKLWRDLVRNCSFICTVRPSQLEAKNCQEWHSPLRVSLPRLSFLQVFLIGTIHEESGLSAGTARVFVRFKGTTQLESGVTGSGLFLRIAMGFLKSSVERPRESSNNIVTIGCATLTASIPNINFDSSYHFS